MYLDKLIKREFLVLIVSVITVTIIVFAVFYINNSNLNNDNSNIITIDNLEIKYCEDLTCKKTITNYGSVIGTNIVNGESSVKEIKKYEQELDVINEKPYVISVKNTSAYPTSLSLYIKEDNDYKPYDNKENLIKLNNLYINNLKVGITNCSNSINPEDVKLFSYSSLEDYLLLDNDRIESNDTNKYCIWTFISNLEENIDNSYFVAKIDFKSKIIK